ncbi:MAG: TolC family protein [Planctomycetes bacterium]|nr:TolC family protein [Planctomycetota bacterium]
MVFVGLAIGLCGRHGCGQEGGPDAPAPSLRPVTLAGCVRLALDNNFQLKAHRLAAGASATGVAAAAGAFDPVLRSRGSYGDQTSPTASALEGTQAPGGSASGGFTGNLGPGFPASTTTNDSPAVPRRQSYSWDLSLEKKFATGTEVAVSYSFERLKTNQYFATINPSYTDQVQFHVTQPLLRGGWFTANLAGLRQSENQRQMAREQLRTATDDLVFNVQQTYWNLVYALENLDVTRESLRLAETLKRDNLEKFKAGTMTRLDVTQADFEIATRKNEVLRASAAVKNTVDRLRQYVDPEGFDADPAEEWHPIDRPLQRGEKAPPFAAALAEAFVHRGDWREGQLAYENAKINEDDYRNQVLPKVDLTYSLRYNGLGGNASDPMRDVLRAEYDSWSVGFLLEWPLGNQSARANYLRAVLDRRRVQADLEELRARIHLEIREAVREINTTFDTITQTREALRFAREQLKGEQARLEVGKSTSYQVLDIQEDLAQAQINERRALLDHMIARAQLERSKGTLLRYFGLAAAPRPGGEERRGDGP